MTNTAFWVMHEGLPDRLPDDWAQYWRPALSSEASLVYEALTSEHLASTEVDLNQITHYLGMSKAAFNRAVRELEGYDFLWLDNEAHPPILTIQEVPVVDPDDPPVPKTGSKPKTPWRTVWEFVNYWCALHERRIDEPYPRPQRGKGRDTYLIDEMLRTYSLETLKAVAYWFFVHRKADEPSTIPYFQFHLPRFVSAWKDEGGVALPKMREEPPERDHSASDEQ